MLEAIWDLIHTWLQPGDLLREKIRGTVLAQRNPSGCRVVSESCFAKLIGRHVGLMDHALSRARV